MNRGLLLAAVLLGPAPAAPQEEIPVQRSLVSLRLGDRLKDVRTLYPPVREWPSFMEPGGGVTRIHMERSYAKYFPDDVEILRLGLRKGSLVDIVVVFDRKYTEKMPLHELVVQLSLDHGEPRRKGGAYLWDDGRTTLRAFESEVPSADGKAIELRTSLEVMDRDFRRRTD